MSRVNVNDMELDELRLAVQTMRPYVEVCHDLEAEVQQLRNDLEQQSRRSGGTDGMTTPINHEILDSIYSLLKRIPSLRDVSRESECVEMFDPNDQQWYEIVVRPIDAPAAGEGE